MGILKRIFAVTVIVPSFLVLMIITHEAGHALTAKVLTGVDVQIYIWPGYELYPDPGAKPASDVHIKGLAMTHIVANDDDFPWLRLDHYENYILLMGSGLTQLLSLLSLCLMTIMRTVSGAAAGPPAMLRWLLIPGALLHIDMLTYTIFPLFNLQHLVLWGGVISEPLIAFARFGIPQYVAVPAVVLLSIVQFFWLHHLTRQRRNHEALRKDGRAKIPAIHGEKGHIKYV